MNLPLDLMTGLIAGLVAAVGICLALGVARLLRKPSEEEAFYDNLAAINKSELEEVDSNTSDSWSGYWDKKYKNTGRTPADDSSAGRWAIIVMVITTVAMVPLLTFGAIFAGPLAGVGLLYLWTSLEASRRTRTLDKQLPLLLSALRANIQASASPQSALMSVADEVPSPLGDELKKVRSDINVSVPLEGALDAFAHRVRSRDIQFLVSSIQTAIASGQDLDPQLATIQRIVEQRTRIRNKLSAAMSEVSVAIWVSGLVIPGGLIYSFMDSENREFWFSLYGLIALAVVAVLYLGGLFTSWRIVKGVENT